MSLVRKRCKFRKENSMSLVRKRCNHFVLRIEDVTHLKMPVQRPVPKFSCIGSLKSTPLKFFVLVAVVLIRSLFSDNIKIVLLQESEVFSSFGEFAFFHTFTNVPMHISSLRVHHVIFLRQSLGENSVNGDIVSNHDSSVRLRRHRISFHFYRCDLVQTNLETSGHPFDEGYLIFLFDFLNTLIPLHGSNFSSVIE